MTWSEESLNRYIVTRMSSLRGSEANVKVKADYNAKWKYRVSHYRKSAKKQEYEMQG